MGLSINTNQKVRQAMLGFKNGGWQIPSPWADIRHVSRNGLNIGGLTLFGLGGGPKWGAKWPSP